MGVYEDPLNTAACLRQAMFSRQMKVKDLATKMGKYSTVISRWRGSKVPDKHLDEICKILGYAKTEFLKLAQKRAD